MQIFDSHFHIIDHRYPLQSNNGFLPDNFLAEDYLSIMQHEKLIGGTVVSGSFHGFDLSYIEPTLKKLGCSFVAVVQVPATISAQEITRLNDIGVRGIRFNLFRGNKHSEKEISSLANKVYSTVGWHSEFYLDSNQLNDLSATLIQLPSASIDHLGLSKTGLNNIALLAEHGIKIKASGFGRVDFDIGSALNKIHLANPEALMFGSDLPSTRAPRKYAPLDIKTINNSFSPDDTKKILYKNALDFYRIKLQ